MNQRTLWLAYVGTAVLITCASSCSEESGQSSAGTAPMVIEPHASVGKIRAGMTQAQVLAELGQPQLKTANALEYTKLGFAVLPGSNGVVQAVMCGDVTGKIGRASCRERV